MKDEEVWVYDHMLPPMLQSVYPAVTVLTSSPYGSPALKLGEYCHLTEALQSHCMPHLGVIRP